jgi:2-dehydropantoate 2-reductase
VTIAVLGAGAMGSYFGGKLALHGAPVVLIDIDAARLYEIARDGLRIEDDHGDRRIALRTSRAADCREPVELVIIFTKGMHTAAAIDSVRHLIGPETWALTLQNGLGNPETIAAAVPPARIAIGVTDLPADLAGPTHVRSHGSGTIRLWSMDGKPSARLGAIAARLDAAGLRCTASPGIATDIWEKAAFNAALNGLAALVRRPVGGLDNAQGRGIATAVVDEAVAAAAASGVAVERARILAKLDFALAHHRDHQPSMLQDVLAGRPTEIEFINGAIARAAERAGLAAPVNQTLRRLVRLLEDGKKEGSPQRHEGHEGALRQD